MIATDMGSEDIYWQIQSRIERGEDIAPVTSNASRTSNMILDDALDDTIKLNGIKRYPVAGEYSRWRKL